MVTNIYLRTTIKNETPTNDIAHTSMLLFVSKVRNRYFRGY